MFCSQSFPSPTWQKLSLETMPPLNEGKFLVTNDLEAKNAEGYMTHLWLVEEVYPLGAHTAELMCTKEEGYTAYIDGVLKVTKLTHWRRLDLEEPSILFYPT